MVMGVLYEEVTLVFVRGTTYDLLLSDCFILGKWSGGRTVGRVVVYKEQEKRSPFSDTNQRPSLTVCLRTVEGNQTISIQVFFWVTGVIVWVG